MRVRRAWVALLLLLTLCTPAHASMLKYQSELPLSYAQGFSVSCYHGGYRLIDVSEGGRYLIVPEGMPVPDALKGDIIVLQQPIERIYLAATSAMSLFDALDALPSIRLSGTQASGWTVDNAILAMERGEILFAGKYSEPDYELMLKQGCELAIESTMILHAPKVKEMIELLGIPVFVDRSSYEQHPLGRAEWIKLYGALLGKEDEAEAFFANQASAVEALSGLENTEKRVAYFSIRQDGTVTLRNPQDYVPRMIEIAGGRYVFDHIEGTSGSSFTMTMEEFYATAMEADYLIYNAAIDVEPKDLADLLAKSELLSDFRAVREGNVWCAGKRFYQATDIMGEMILDMHRMMTDGEGAMTFLYPLK